MLKLNSYTLLLALSVSVFHSKAQETKSNSFSLQQSIDYAYKNSPNYLNAQNDVLMAKYKRKEVLGMAMPQINTSVDMKNFLSIPTSLIPGEIFGAPAGSFIPVKFGTTFQATGTAQASLLVFSADYLVGLKITKEMIELTNILVNRSKAETYNQVAKAYYSVLISKKRLVSIDANIAKLNKLFNDTKATSEQGFVEQIDVDRLEVTYNNLLTEKLKIERLANFSESSLKFQMGYIGKENLVLTDSLSVGDNAELDINKIDVSNRPEIRVLNAQQSVYSLNVKRLKYGYLPSLVAYGSLGYSSMRNDLKYFDRSNNWYPTALIGGTLSLNIFDGFQRHYKIQQAKLDFKKGENSLKQAQLATELESSISAINYNNAIASLKTQDRNLKLAERIYEVAQKKYAQGVGSNLEVINAQTSLREAETNYYSAIYDVLYNKIDYLKATGTLVK